MKSENERGLCPRPVMVLSVRVSVQLIIATATRPSGQTPHREGTTSRLVGNPILA